MNHLYIHVPFCLRRCSYCDFAVTATQEAPVDAWLEATQTELALALRDEGWTEPVLETVYVGGGTPSLLGPGTMARLRASLERHARVAPDAEWTAEANPETFTRELALGWRDAGVTRVSLGAQTFHEPALRWMGRVHGPHGPGRAVEAARAAGIEDVSLDLIFGLPERLGRDWGADLDRLLALEPTHVSLYGLTAESATPLGRWVREGREAMPEEESYEAEYLLAADRLAGAGFEHYEVSNFALPGRRSRHNSAYWNGRSYLGLGAGAHSYRPPYRWWNERDWAAYLQRVEGGERPEIGRETVTGEAARLERAWLGLRTREGVPLAEWPGTDALVEAWRREGWARPDPGWLRLTPRGWMLLDRLAVELADTGDVA